MSPIRRRAAQSAGDENEFESMWNQTMLVPSRPPLNSIPDPSQYQSQQSQFQFEDKPESSSRRRKYEGVGERQLISSLMRTPKVNGRARSANSEPNSAQSTPSRSGHRVSIGGSTFTRLPSQFGNGGGRAGLLPRDSYSRRFSIATPQQLLADVPHFDLDHDPSFWNDHNVQVLIRIRPLNSSEMVSQGYGRCLRQESPQTVVWQGHPETRFTFDHISCESMSQEKLFRVAGLPMVDNCMSGYNSCMFAYGQTGSGKTYTMMGDIDNMDGKLSEDCGITPRIFEYLFSRIRKEEESRVQERLTYSCKCSFLEIYNEQITDLLEPSSINLQLREDMKKGVYVENLSEHSVGTVNDVLQLLQQGAANRKIAATYMNSESSRSHSVFTCVIESRWEKDSMAHLRFGRLNLVDLAGSERQKTSGAEGDRLKEAANINKSLSTLGLVIMSLVDLAQGKHRHVPYRDSRLTFLLQDSLGGNSKTTIIANVSPSICSANETLSTLKFAQRAKLIQNNAKINEDASADALQYQIQQLKDQLSFLMKHQHSSIELVNIVPGTKQRCLDYFSEGHKPTKEIKVHDVCENQKEEIMKNNSLKAILQGSLRRERLAETEIRSLKAEIEHLNRLSHQQEEETQRTKMMLKFREDKIKRLELLLDGLISADEFYSDENSALREENQLLQAKIERNPEVIRFAAENIRLLEQIRQFQEFYQQGERETLLAEISELRNQFLESREVEKSHTYQQFSPMKIDQEHEVTKELVLCKHMNSNLLREVDELQQRLSNRRDSSLDTLNSIENVSLGNDCVDEVTSNNMVANGKNDETDNIMKNQYEDLEKQLMNAQSLIETMKFEQFQLLKNLEFIQTKNESLVAMLERNHCLSVSIKDTEGISTLALQTKLEKLTKELKEAKILNEQYIEDHATQSSEHHQTELVRSEVEMETTRTIIHLQEEIDRLQSEFHVCLCSMTEENSSLRNCVAAKEEELRVFCAEWERATLELTTFLMDGSRSLRNASHQIKSISSSFPNVNDWINERVERAAQIFVEKEETILQLQKSLEDAQYTVMHIEEKLYSLRGAAISLTEFQQPQNTSETEEFQMFRMPNESAFVKESPKNRSWSRKSQMCENQAIDCFTRTPGAVGNLPSAQTDSLAATDVENKTKLATLLDVDGLDQPTGERAEASMNKFDEVAFDDKHSEPSIFFANFEEAFAAMREADHTLKAMLKANENANTLKTMWKEAAEELMSNSASMREETKQFKSCVSLGVKDKEVLQNAVQFSLNEMDCMLAFLEESFPAMQTEVEKLFETTCSDAKKIVEQTLAFFGSFRSSLEDLMCKALQNDISILVLQSQMGEYSKNFKSLSPASNTHRSIHRECSVSFDDLVVSHTSLVHNSVLQPMKYGCKGSQVECASREETKDPELVDGDTLDEHSILQRELQRKDVLLKGLLFDFSLLQEFASHRKDIKDELEKLIVAMNNVQQQLQVKSIELDNMLIEKIKLEDHFSEAEKALFNSNSELSQTKETLNVLSEQNIALKDLSKDLYLKNSEAEQLLEDQRLAIQSLEKEIVRLSSLHDKQPVWSIEDYEGALTEVSTERDLLLEKLTSLQDKLDMASALADENQAIAAEARQVSETSKCYAEQKEEEVKILERCVEELESTINVLEKRVLEMEEDVEKQRLIRDSLELEIQELRDRLLTVEDLTESMTSENSCAAVFEDQISRKLHQRSLEIKEARSRIRVLEEENAKQAKEIRQFKDYISELILHAEAQASQYQQKYKSLEAMLDEVKTDVANVSAGQISERADKISARTRGSSSPFRCISTLVQQMNQEKDQELSSAKSRIDELEALAACRYKEVCALNTKLASAESMTHDVIRDLLSVKLDISNYANIIEQDQLQKLIEEAHQHRQNFVAMEREIVNLRSQIHELCEDRERCISEMNKNNTDQLTIQIALEHLQERDQLLTAQNDMLKTDKTNLQRKVAELDDMVRKLFSMQESQQPRNQPRNSSFSRSFGSDLSERLARSQKVLSRVNDQLAQYRRPDGTSQDAKVNANTHEAKLKGCKNRYQNHF